MHQQPYTLSVELTENGMIVRYREAVKQVREIRPAHNSILSESMIQGIKLGLTSFFGDDDGEEWNEKKQRKMQIIDTVINKLTEESKPKKIEEYVWEQRLLSCRNSQDLAGAIETAKAAWVAARELIHQGKFNPYGHVGYLTGMPAPAYAQAPMGMGDYIATGEPPDFSLGA
jgi:hypothetical protein